jgi:hypothetical protein
MLPSRWSEPLNPIGQKPFSTAGSGLGIWLLRLFNGNALRANYIALGGVAALTVKGCELKRSRSIVGLDRNKVSPTVANRADDQIQARKRSIHDDLRDAVSAISPPAIKTHLQTTGSGTNQFAQI